MRSHINAFALALLLTASTAYPAECDNPTAVEQIAQCVGRELRESDARINASYGQLMSKLGEADKANLRTEQRSWIKTRDSVCRLDTKESDREQWYQALLTDYAKTVCVTRYTRLRTAQLEAMLSNLDAKSSGAAPAPVSPLPESPAAPTSAENGKTRTPTLHANGKWYFEVTVDYAATVKIGPVVMAAGVTNQQQMTGILDNIRMRDAGKDVMRYGIAVDLDNGKLYYSQNGTWINGAPGTNEGMDLKLGRQYGAMVSVSADGHYLFRRAIEASWGDSPMAYALPAGYSPWRNRGHD